MRYLPGPETPRVFSSTGHTCFVIYCSECHTGLCKLIEVSAGFVGDKVHNIMLVAPCPVCVQAALGGRSPEVIPLPKKYEDIIHAVQEDHLREK